jgi:hypothetical protein
MGPRRKRKGQYSIYADHREPDRWRKKMDKGRGPGKQDGLTIDEALTALMSEAEEERATADSRYIHCLCGNGGANASWGLVHMASGIGERDIW